MRILFTAGPAYGLTLPVVPLVWAARAAGHEVLFVSASEMVEVGSRAGLPMVDLFPDRERWDVVMGAVLSPGGTSAEQVASVQGGARPRPGDDHRRRGARHGAQVAG